MLFWAEEDHRLLVVLSVGLTLCDTTSSNGDLNHSMYTDISIIIICIPEAPESPNMWQRN